MAAEVHRPEHLANAPITEALLDIRATLPDSFDARTFEAAHARIRTDYPIVERHHRSTESEIRVGAEHRRSSRAR
jgi:uncharacterized protein (TIGR04255 family)